ncbi:hypothetical protein [Anaerocolumna xylanovorans]|uniref:Uncharacterized protein n=1 Tax=Anaerocolumna xylanovorans DSM 12503 TaxID=1121345 RepID=A0A1M7Y0Y0_9FIRM|nr:hypothetical protein [Anaerocolumna xylanovorans]SHO45073.1 hypothetical protein SAMN02745217_00816 [Anaerocolumna xylanovorans DSM 12503]
MHNKRFIKIMFLILLVFCFNSNDVLAANNTNKPEDTLIKSSGKSLSDFIPKDWKLISKVQRDLNKDKLKDIAAVIEYTGEYNASDEEEMSGPPRILFIVFKKKDGTYKLSVQSASLIMRAGEGGVFGDPFAGMEYSRGSIVVSLYGGSSWRWGYTHRFRFQNKGWYLIGETDETYNINTGESETIDTNCLTGKQIITTIDINGKKNVVSHNVGIKKLKRLIDL